MIVQADAKINLGLRILGKRVDGFHNLETIFTRVMPSDEIEFHPSDGLALQCDRPDIPVDGSNLVLRAAEALRREFQSKLGATIVLRKRIPAGAGLGGGSSDAAATLMALNRMWALGASPLQLHELALHIGSDVPYFLTAGSAAATGRGELLSPITLDLPFFIVVIYPGVHVSTSWAYARLPADRLMNRTPLVHILMERQTDPKSWIGCVDNDFEMPVCEAYPVVRSAQKALYTHGALFAQLSGSGSAVYGIFNREPDLAALQNTLPVDHQLFMTPPGFRAHGLAH